MFRQRAVACFTIHMRMLSFILRIGDIGVARFACLMAGIIDRLRREFIQCCTTIVPVLTKGLGDEETSYDEEAHESHQENSCQPKQMACIF